MSLHYYCNPMPKEYPEFKILISSSQAKQTKELLEKCFNGDHTGQKKLESSTSFYNVKRKLGELGYGTK